MTAELLNRPGVLALGGGAVLSPQTRAALRGRRVVWLRVGLAAAVKRVGLDDRPAAAAGQRRGRLLTLLNERAPLYAEVATEVVDTDESDPGRGGGRRSWPVPSEQPTPTRIEVAGANTPYQVLVGHRPAGGGARAARRGGAAGRGDPPADPGRAAPHGWSPALAASRAGGGAGSRCPTPRRPRPPRWPRTAGRCWAAPGSPGPTPWSGVGGGSTTDLAGFVAATWLRGVPLVNVPTTRAGHGGRRRRRQDRDQHRRREEPGGQLPRAGRGGLRPGLPGHACRPADLVAGLAEVVKCGFIADPEILDLVEADPGGGRGPGLAGAARAHRAGDPGQGGRGLGRPAGGDLGRHPGGSGAAQLRAHPRPRHRAPRGLPHAARRGDQRRHGVRRRAGPAGRPAGSATADRHAAILSGWACPPRTRRTPSTSCWPRWRWTRRPAAPRCGSSS